MHFIQNLYVKSKKHKPFPRHGVYLENQMVFLTSIVWRTYSYSALGTEVQTTTIIEKSKEKFKM